MSGKLITHSDPERVRLESVYYHFLALAPSPRKATIDLSSAIREGQLGLSAGKVIELRPGKTQPVITFNQAIPADAIADRMRITFDWEFSKAIWEQRPPRSYFTFENITAARDQVLALRPGPNDAEPKRRGGGRKAQFNWDEVWACICCLLHDEGWPEKGDLRKFAKKVCDACAGVGMEPTPDPDTVRKKLTTLLEVKEARDAEAKKK